MGGYDDSLATAAERLLQDTGELRVPVRYPDVARGFLLGYLLEARNDSP